MTRKTSSRRGATSWPSRPGGREPESPLATLRPGVELLFRTKSDHRPRMGKSGLVGRKIAATLASCGTPRCSSTRQKPATAIWA